MKIKKAKTVAATEHTDDVFHDEDFEGNYSIVKWYEQLASITYAPSVTDQVLIELKEEAKKCLENEIANYNIKNSKSNGNYRWMKTVINKGTVADKVAANVLMIQENPVNNLETIKNLVGMVKVGKKKECILIIENLTELFINDLLRQDAKLKSFQEQPLSKLMELCSGNAVTRKKYLCYWYFENELKETYKNFVIALNTAAHDSVESNKEKAIAAMGKLLAGNAEQEKNLLLHLVNKLGDPSQKVASKAMFCLSQVLQKHSNMQGVTLIEIEKLLFRSNILKKAQYYSLCFLSQFFLNNTNPELARRLIEVYFSFFKKCIKEGDVDSRMLSVLLIGVKRAYPYAKLELEKLTEHLDTMYRIVYAANFNVSLNALCLLYQVSQSSSASIKDRFYSALYKKLFDPNLPLTNYQAILLNLVYKALSKDNRPERIIAFVKRLLQIATNVQPSFACGLLFLVSQVLFTKNCNEHNLLLLSLTRREQKLPNEDVDDDDDDEEKYQDIEESEKTEVLQECSEEEEDEKEEEKEKEREAWFSAPGWFHRLNSKTDEKSSKKLKQSTADYDATTRNPLHAKTQYVAYNELYKLKNHFHPSVRLFADNILQGKKVIYSGDPLKDFVLIRFLDRFVFKNPKKTDENGESVNPTFARRKLYQTQGVRSIPVFSNMYLQQREENIPVDELFVYTYLQNKYKEKQLSEKDDEDGSDLESVASDEFEEMLGKMNRFKDVDEFEDVDFMNDVKETQKIKKTKQNKDRSGDVEEADESSVSEDEDESEDTTTVDREQLSDVSDDLDVDSEFDDEEDDQDDDEEIVFDSDSDVEEEVPRKKPKRNSTSIFAASEEFASLLEEEGSSKRAPGSHHQVLNADKSAAKQLDWEERRHRWINGYNKAVGNKKKSGNKKRPKSKGSGKK